MRLFYPAEDGGCQQTTDTAERESRMSPTRHGDRLRGRNRPAQEQDSESSQGNEWFELYCWVITQPRFHFLLKVHCCRCFAWCFALGKKKKIKKKTKYSVESKNGRKICKFLSITWCTSSPETLRSFWAIAENAVEHRATGDKQWKCLMAHRKRAEKIGVAGLGRKECVHNMM